MSVLRSWTGGAIVLLALAGGLRAEVMVGQSYTGDAEPGLMTMLGQEREGLDAVPAARMSRIVVPPAAAPEETKGTPEALTLAWLDQQPVVKGDAERDCLANAIYHEARGEGIEGQQAVAEVVLNRVDDGSFPKSVCAVVEQRASGGCQFSFTCDGKSDKPGDRAAYEMAEKIANVMLEGFPRSLTDGATYFHTRGVAPSWSRRFERTAKIGAHLFYRRPVMTASN